MSTSTLTALKELLSTKKKRGRPVGKKKLASTIQAASTALTNSTRESNFTETVALITLLVDLLASKTISLENPCHVFSMFFDPIIELCERKTLGELEKKTIDIVFDGVWDVINDDLLPKNEVGPSVFETLFTTLCDERLSLKSRRTASFAVTILLTGSKQNKSFLHAAAFLDLSTVGARLLAAPDYELQSLILEILFRLRPRNSEEARVFATRLFPGKNNRLLKMYLDLGKVDYELEARGLVNFINCNNDGLVKYPKTLSVEKVVLCGRQTFPPAGQSNFWLDLNRETLALKLRWDQKNAEELEDVDCAYEKIGGWDYKADECNPDNGNTASILRIYLNEPFRIVNSVPQPTVSPSGTWTLELFFSNEKGKTNGANAENGVEFFSKLFDGHGVPKRRHSAPMIDISLSKPKHPPRAEAAAMRWKEKGEDSFESSTKIRKPNLVSSNIFDISPQRSTNSPPLEMKQIRNCTHHPENVLNLAGVAELAPKRTTPHGVETPTKGIVGGIRPQKRKDANVKKITKTEASSCAETVRVREPVAPAAKVVQIMKNAVVVPARRTPLESPSHRGARTQTVQNFGKSNHVSVEEEKAASVKEKTVNFANEHAGHDNDHVCGLSWQSSEEEQVAEDDDGSGEYVEPGRENRSRHNTGSRKSERRDTDTHSERVETKPVRAGATEPQLQATGKNSRPTIVSGSRATQGRPSIAGESTATQGRPSIAGGSTAPQGRPSNAGGFLDKVVFDKRPPIARTVPEKAEQNPFMAKNPNGSTLIAKRWSTERIVLSQQEIPGNISLSDEESVSERESNIQNQLTTVVSGLSSISCASSSSASTSSMANLLPPLSNRLNLDQIIDVPPSNRTVVNAENSTLEKSGQGYGQRGGSHFDSSKMTGLDSQPDFLNRSPYHTRLRPTVKQRCGAGRELPVQEAYRKRIGSPYQESPNKRLQRRGGYDDEMEGGFHGKEGVESRMSGNETGLGKGGELEALERELTQMISEIGEILFCRFAEKRHLVTCERLDAVSHCREAVKEWMLSELDQQGHVALKLKRPFDTAFDEMLETEKMYRHGAEEIDVLFDIVAFQHGNDPSRSEPIRGSILACFDTFAIEALESSDATASECSGLVAD